MSKQKLELTWVGKDHRPRLEPRVLLPDESKSYVAEHHVTENDVFDNRLIFGDNLLALKALEGELAGKVKCIYIDPPFNTGQAFENYDDGLEHSYWLTLMRSRLEILHRLLSNDGTIFAHIDDENLGYLTVLLDEVFGRANKANIITFKQGSATGHKAINPGAVTTTNFILIYAKDKSQWQPNRVFTARERDKRYSQFITNRESHYQDWSFTTLTRAYAASKGISEAVARKIVKSNPEKMDEFVLENHKSVIQLVKPDYSSVSADARQLIDQSLRHPSNIYLLERDGYSDMYFVSGQRILFYTNKLKEIDGEYVAGEPLTTLWDDLLSNNLHNEGGVRFPKGKKPEALLKRVLEIATNPGDLVLDSFAGSGTTGAVAHKMGRRWIMVELQETAHTHIIPRLKKVIDGEDQGGISKSVNWQGGGGFRYYKLAPSVLAKDKWDNWVINPEFNAEMLSEAMCKLEGFTYEPSDTLYWLHGYSTEQDFIYVTTQHLTAQHLQVLSDEVGSERSLLIMCGAYGSDIDLLGLPNLTVKKIPQAVLNKCEWGRDDYSLKVENLPQAPKLDEGYSERVQETPEQLGPLFEAAVES